MWCALLVVAGVAVAAVGVRIATERRRPIDLLGMLMAPAGLLGVYAGIACWLQSR